MPAYSPTALDGDLVVPTKQQHACPVFASTLASMIDDDLQLVQTRASSLTAHVSSRPSAHPPSASTPRPHPSTLL